MNVINEVIYFECTENKIKGGSSVKGNNSNSAITLPYSNKVTRCGHEPLMYSKMFDSAYGERTLYFCLCNECKVGTMGYHNPVDAVRAWDNDDVYSDCVTKDGYGMKLVWG